MSESLLCPNCGLRLVYDDANGEYICKKCGYVSTIRVENRTLGMDAKLQKLMAGSMEQVPAMYRNYIGNRSDEANLDGQSKKLRKLDFRLQDPREKMLIAITRQILDIREKLNLNSFTVELANKICWGAIKGGLCKNRRQAVIAATAVFAACRATGEVRTFKELAEVTNTTKGAISRMYTTFQKNSLVGRANSPLISYITKLVNRLQLSVQTEKTAVRLAELLNRSELVYGKQPAGIAGAVVFVAARMYDEHIRLSEITQYGGIKEVTLRKNLKQLLTMYDINVLLSPENKKITESAKP